MNKRLSVFIDESGDFGPLKPHAPYYISKSETEFFGNTRDFKKNYLKPMLRKKL